MNGHSEDEEMFGLSPFDINTWLNFSDDKREPGAKHEELVIQLADEELPPGPHIIEQDFLSVTQMTSTYISDTSLPIPLDATGAGLNTTQSVFIDLAEETYVDSPKLWGEYTDFGEAEEQHVFQNIKIAHQDPIIEVAQDTSAKIEGALESTEMQPIIPPPPPKRRRSLTGRRRSRKSLDEIAAQSITNSDSVHPPPLHLPLLPSQLAVADAKTPSPRKQTPLSPNTRSSRTKDQDSTPSLSPRLKKTLSAYQIFCQKNKADFKAAHPLFSYNDVQRLLGARWKSLTAEEKAPYEEMALEEKNRFLASAEGQEQVKLQKQLADEKRKAKLEEERKRLEAERAQKREESKKRREEKKKIELEEKERRQDELRRKEEEKHNGKEIISGLYLGNRHVAKNPDWMVRSGCRFVVNVTSELKNHFEGQGIDYLRIRAHDDPGMDLMKHFAEATDYIASSLAECRKRILDDFSEEEEKENTDINNAQKSFEEENEEKKKEAETSVIATTATETKEVNTEETVEGISADKTKEENQKLALNGAVLVHCSEGRSRSPSIIIAYLMRFEGWPLKKAYEQLLQVSPNLNINAAFKQQLMDYEKQVRGDSSFDFFPSIRRSNSFSSPSPAQPQRTTGLGIPGRKNNKRKSEGSALSSSLSTSESVRPSKRRAVSLDNRIGIKSEKTEDPRKVKSAPVTPAEVRRNEGQAISIVVEDTENQEGKEEKGKEKESDSEKETEISHVKQGKRTKKEIISPIGKRKREETEKKPTPNKRRESKRQAIKRGETLKKDNEEKEEKTKRGHESEGEESSAVVVKQETKATKKRKTKGEEDNEKEEGGAFDENTVKTWSAARLTAWVQRKKNPNAYYYRFTDPGTSQAAGNMTDEEHRIFLNRLVEFKRNGWHVGSFWGLFSKVLPHRVGYQCSSYYRKLIKDGTVTDESYIVDGGAVKFTSSKGPNKSTGPDNELNDVWKTPGVVKLEKQIDKWVAQYHNNGASPGALAVKRKRRSDSDATVTTTTAAKTPTPKKGKRTSASKQKPAPKKAKTATATPSKRKAFTPPATPTTAKTATRSSPSPKTAKTTTTAASPKQTTPTKTTSPSPKKTTTASPKQTTPTKTTSPSPTATTTSTTTTTTTTTTTRRKKSASTGGTTAARKYVGFAPPKKSRTYN